MPVRVVPSSHGANIRTDTFAQVSAKELLTCACPSLDVKSLSILQTSFEGNGLPENVTTATNGLVHGVVEAYSLHRHLVLRPEDIWFAILTQLSSYINANAEDLREKFVTHQGQKELVIKYSTGSRYDVDFDHFARTMSELIQQNIIDPDLRKWIIPSFSTTTRVDEAVASIVMMGTMQKYFAYTCEVCCGIPSVTLLGEREDYEVMLGKLEKLTTFGSEPTQFAALLRPIITRMIYTFDNPSDLAVLGFWRRILDVEDNMSGSDCYSGWISAFCFWDEDGKPMYHINDDTKYSENDEFGDSITGEGSEKYQDHNELHLNLDGQRYYSISSDDIPPGWVQVPVKIDDHGLIVPSVMVAGSVGMSWTSSNVKSENGELGIDTLQPITGWWICEKSDSYQEGQVSSINWDEFSDYEE